MKIRYPVIAIIVILIIEINFGTLLPFELSETLGLLILVCLGLIAYLMVRNIFRTIKGIVTKPKEGRRISGLSSCGLENALSKNGNPLQSRSKETLKSKNQNRKQNQKGKYCEE